MQKQQQSWRIEQPSSWENGGSLQNLEAWVCSLFVVPAMVAIPGPIPGMMMQTQDSWVYLGGGKCP